MLSNPRLPRLVKALALTAILPLLVVACGGKSQGTSAEGVVVQTIAPTASAAEVVGGKPAASPTAAGDPKTAPAATATPGPTVPPPQTGKWIDVDVTRFVVRLMDGTSIVQTIQPVAVGAQIDTGAYESTQTGLFHVYNKVKDLAYDAPYQTYISDWVGFDPQRANGFHSFLKDKDGNVVDPSTGRISNGCVRTGAAEAVFAFAQIGMPVYVHY